MTGVISFGGTAEVVEDRCSGGLVLYLATAWAYDSGYESDFVSRNGSGIPCWVNTIPRSPEKFRLVRKNDAGLLQKR